MIPAEAPASTVSANDFPLAECAGGDRQPRHRSDRRQRFAPEPQGGDAQEIELSVSARRELRGRVTFEREGELVTGKPGAIVGHQNTRQSAAVRLNIDLRCAGVDGVFDQLLDRASRTLHDFAGGNPIDQVRRQAAYRHRRRI